MKWKKTCPNCKKEFTSDDFVGDYCDECDRKRIPEGSAYYKLRFEILMRDNFTCKYCGATPEDGVKLQVDHISAKHNGGCDDKENLITSCNVCNLGKSDVLLKKHQEKKIKERVVTN